MALRSVNTGNVESFRACAIELRDDRVVLIGVYAGWRKERMDGLCPVHKSAACIETYFAAEDLTRWSLWTFWEWRSRMRRMRGGR
ncbi:hypothetical protein O7626_39830 [Micromonospora sp. WMMD1102]|uniref:hypothetical protein n=1 Tax=Micromonospora sp. WMMD1102 TaxID=3016105 RepID=UPI0024153815|nr:hypothetical protein [Micromonospora sp. WMMD1102]MDG4791966.1 hypothetical protein [Micromonospora sp. WMMD1102]